MKLWLYRNGKTKNGFADLSVIRYCFFQSSVWAANGNFWTASSATASTEPDQGNMMHCCIHLAELGGPH